MRISSKPINGKELLCSGLHDIVVALESLPPSTGYRVSGAIAKMAILRDRAPSTYAVLYIWITRYSGIWPWGATKDVALEMGVSERAIHKRLVRISGDDMFSSFLFWRRSEDEGLDGMRKDQEQIPELIEIRSVSSLAEEHNVSRVTIYAWIRKGKVSKLVYKNKKTDL